MGYRSDNWWVSNFDYNPEVTKKWNLAKKVSLHDVTLRDGEQTPGVVLSVEDKVEIAKMLDDLGVERIEAGMPAVSEEDREAIKRITALGLKAKIFTFARAKKEDIDMAVDCHADGVIIEIPTSRPKLLYQFPKWTDDDVIELSIEVIGYAKEKRLETVYFGYDTTRADEDFLFRLYDRIVKEASPDSIGIVDTMGSALPSAMYYIVRKVKERYPGMKVEVHCHNDYGLAVGTSFAAVEAGADVVHAAINGMGERCGNTALEPVMVGLKTLYGLDNPYHCELLKKVSDRVEEISRFKKPVNQPFVGDNDYIRESGIGIDLVENTPLAMFAVTPSYVGNKSGIVLGKKSGVTSIEVKLQKLGLPPVEKELGKKILAEVKEYSITTKHLLNDEEFLAIVKKYTHQGA
jgi:methanogen homocitrate synthase